MYYIDIIKGKNHFPYLEELGQLKLFDTQNAALRYLRENNIEGKVGKMQNCRRTGFKT